MSTAKKRFQMPHTMMIIIAIMLLVVIASWIIPSGEYSRVEDPETGVTVVDPESFTYVEDAPITVMDFFTSLHTGISMQANVFITLLYSSGMIALVQESGAITIGVRKIMKKMKGKEILVVILMNLLFTAFGALSMNEGVFTLIPLCVSIIMAMGYDRITGFAAAVMGLTAGFGSGLVNVYTIGTAQQILGLPMFSGLWYRAIGLVFFTVADVLYLVWYADRIRKDPSKSYCKDEYLASRDTLIESEGGPDEAFTWKHIVILLIFFGTLALKPVGSLLWGWGMVQMNAINLMAAGLIMVVLWQNVNTSCKIFMSGCMKIVPAAIAVGASAAVVVLLEQSKILDTIVHAMATLLMNRSVLITLVLLFLFVVAFNALLASGSGKAVILMPIFGPLAELLNINRQVIAHLYIWGDGFTNYLWTGALPLAEMCDVSWTQWFRYAWKIMSILSIIGLGMVIVANGSGFGPF